MTQDAKVRAKGIVHVLDDDASVRTALSRLLTAVGYEVHTHANASTYLLQPVSDRPACLILDVRMPEVSGLDIQDALARLRIEIPIIFLTGHGDIPTTVRAMKAGAAEFLTKPVRPRALLAAIQAALEGDRTSQRTRLELAELRERYERLTPREQEVMCLVVAGLLNKQIAGELGAAERTVKFHRAHIMEKMRADSLANLVRMAGRLDIAFPPPGAAPEGS
jgi:FixJ family two-component response regulator